MALLPTSPFCTEFRADSELRCSVQDSEPQNLASWETSKEAITKAQVGTIYLVCAYLFQQSGTIAFENCEV